MTYAACYFFHATSATKWAAIRESGALQTGSYFAVKAIADYYTETIEDEGEDAVLLAIPVSFFTANADNQGIDWGGIEEPVCFTAFGLTEDDVHEAWEASDQDVASCIDIIGSFQFHAPVPIAHIIEWDQR